MKLQLLLIEVNCVLFSGLRKDNNAKMQAMGLEKACLFISSLWSCMLTGSEISK